ncbi:hypothetical protein BSL78_29925 [Apostichopus japonicus]|uniref:Uncharacterized protein n=1 Tax=Stichopus japonicus TaxID=307972 RepID=A0A2G8JC19_STIJA|nr:hypothetical protein BSL78_29925 [Apostichopus japonicus]
MVLSAAGNCLGKYFWKMSIDIQEQHVGLSSPVKKNIVLHLASAEALAKGKCGHNYLHEFAITARNAWQGREPREWGAGLLAALRLAFQHIINDGRNTSENGQEWQHFEDRWKEYLSLRGIINGENRPKFPKKFKFREERERFYRRFALPRTVHGSCSHDAPLIAYDALLYSSSWKDLCTYAMQHGGDCRASASIAGGWWGILHGFDGVPINHYDQVEFKDRLLTAATSIYSISWM